MSSDAVGKFIVVEGPSGVGKTTVIAAVAKLLARDASSRVVLVKQPSSSALGALAREMADELHGESLACLVAADRYEQLSREIRPKVRTGHIVLCDRYVPSSLVLQVLDGVDESFIEMINGRTDRADLYVFLDGDATETRERSYERGPRDRFHADVPASLEASRYRDVAAKLTSQGYGVMCVGTSGRSVASIAEEVAAGIAAIGASDDKDPTRAGFSARPFQT